MGPSSHRRSLLRTTSSSRLSGTKQRLRNSPS